MNVRVHKVSERFVHQAVLRNTAETTEAGRSDAYVEVAPAVPGAGMTRMKVTLVGNFQEAGVKCGRQALPDCRDPRA